MLWKAARLDLDQVSGPEIATVEDQVGPAGTHGQAWNRARQRLDNVHETLVAKAPGDVYEKAVAPPSTQDDARWAPLFALLAAFFGFCPGCGGDSVASQGVEAPDHASENDDPAATASGAAEDSEDGEEAEPARGPNCDDGTCGLCAGSLCPTGWYCDEGVKACSWLRECTDKASCACVTRVLGASCKCSEEGGLAHVECG